jgi:hypothetical protein
MNPCREIIIGGSNEIYGYLASKFEMKYTLEETVRMQAQYLLKATSFDIKKEQIKRDLFNIFLFDDLSRPQELDIHNRFVVLAVYSCLCKYIDSITLEYDCRFILQPNFFHFIHFLKSTAWYASNF